MNPHTGTAVITGASSGIGLATARRLLADGYRVVCLARRDCPEPGVESIKTDMTDEDSVRAAFERIKREYGGIGLFVSNAGMGISGSIEDTDLKSAKKQFDVNFFGCFLGAKYALPLLREEKGRIINISSVASVLPIPYQSFYSASKAAINAFTFALASEAEKFGVSCCAVMPGDVKSGFTAAREKAKNSELYGKSAEKSVSSMEKDEQNGMDAAFIASFIARIAKKRTVAPLYTPGAKYKLFVFVTRLVPNRLARYIVSKLYC